MTNKNLERLNSWVKHPSQRGYFSYELYRAMSEDPTIYFLTADLGYRVFDAHLEDFPDRAKSIGANEQLMMGCAVGMAQEGLKPFCYSITPFLLSRGHEWIRNYINHEQAPVRLVGSGRDDSYKHDGFSHYAYDDMDIVRPFTNIQILRPNTKEDVPVMVDMMVRQDRPWYINLSR